MDLNKLYQKTITIFFLLMFSTAIFSYNIDYDRINCETCNNADFKSEDATDGKVDFGEGCYTEYLSEEEIENIWDEILIKGFRVKSIGDGNDINKPKDRDNLDQNQLMLTDKDNKSNDIVLKKEMPSKLMDPSETPSLLGQYCNGPYSFSVNLEDTLRVGRCTDTNSPCYLREEGLFRLNSNQGFLREINTVKKDLLDMLYINKLSQETDKLLTDKNYQTNVDLGLFSDMSYSELATLKDNAFDENTDSIDIEKMKTLNDKQVQNKIETYKFDAGMETTCNGDNCYINVYSLFDKMFNQYFSADLVASSVGPLMWNTSKSIFKGLGNVTGVSKLTNKHLKKGSFLDELLNKGTSPVKAFRNAQDFKFASKNFEKFSNNIADVSKTNRILQQYDLKPQYDKYLEAISGKNFKKFELDNFYKSGEFAKLTKTEKRVFTQVTKEHYQKVATARNVIDMTKNEVYDDAVKNFSKGLNEGMAPGEIIDAGYITKDQYQKLVDVGQKTQMLSESLEKSTFKNYKWKDSLEKVNVTKTRNYKVGNDTIGVNVESAVEPGSYKMINDSAFKFEIDTKNNMISTKAGKQYKTQKITQDFPGGESLEIEKIVPSKTTIAELPYEKRLNKNKLKEVINRQENGIVKYTDSGGITHSVRLDTLDEKAIDALPDSPFDIYKFKNETLTNIDDIKKYGYDPAELAVHFEKASSKNIEGLSNNSKDMVTFLNNQGWNTGRSVNWVNKQMQQMDITKYKKQPLNILTSSPKAYLWNWMYWEAKRGGADIPFLGGIFEKYSMYQLPETYTSVNFTHKDGPLVYNDAYIDFFANDGSDQGDLFAKYFNSLLFWVVNLTKEGLEKADTKITDTADDWVKKLTENMIRRSSTDDIVLFMDAQNNNCTEDCSIKMGDSRVLDQATKETNQLDITNNPLDSLALTTTTPSGINTNNYILENTSQENFEDEGQTLISFSHHTDYSGSMNGETSKEPPIDLVDAKNQELTCRDSMEELSLAGIPIGFVFSKENPYRAGFNLALISNVSYFMLSAPHHRALLGALVGDVIPQVIVMPQINECVDDQEGYYSHIFVSHKEFERIEDDPKNKVGDLVEKGADNLSKSSDKLTTESALKDPLKKGADEIKKLATQKLQDHPITQARFKTYGDTTGNVTGKLFFLELGKGTVCKASMYSDKGKELLKGTDNRDLMIDKESGEINIKEEDGTIKNIINDKHKDFTRLTNTNLAIPAKIIPHSLSYIPISDSNSELFEIDIYGNVTVKDQDFLNCLKSNYKEQTGRLLKGDILTDYFGSLEVAVTTNPLNPETQYDVMPRGHKGSNKIVAEGSPRKVAESENAKATILNNRNTTITPLLSGNNMLGKNLSLEFEDAQLIYHGETNSYIMWVEKTASVHQSDVSDMTSEHTTYSNPETGCEEDAFNLKLKSTDNPQSKEKVDEMNKALENVGPFQMFETDTKTFIFYTGDPPECEQRMKIIDKETGEVITDQKVTDLVQTPNGMKVTTEDGAEHDFEFSAKDGIPKLKYNDKTETLNSAQGKNGAFWYDPNTGEWYTENGHLIPMDPEYKDGITFKVDDNGNVTGTPSQNPMNINIGQGGDSGSGSFNVPLAPEKTSLLIAYILLIIMGFLGIYTRLEKEK